MAHQEKKKKEKSHQTKAMKEKKQKHQAPPQQMIQCRNKVKTQKQSKSSNKDH